jgi:hypothetical protein
MKRKEISKLNENYLKRVDYCSNRGYYNNYWFYQVNNWAWKG